MAKKWNRTNLVGIIRVFDPVTGEGKVWQTGPAKSDGTLPLRGDGKHYEHHLYATKFPPDVVSQFTVGKSIKFDVNKDDVLAISDPAARERSMVVRIVGFDPADGIPLDAVNLAPASTPVVVAPATPTVVAPEPSEEHWKLEVLGDPVGGDDSGEWNISVEVEKDNQAVSEMAVTLRCGSDKREIVTLPNGCVEEAFTVTDDSYLRVVADSTLSISAIPLAGPDKPIVPLADVAKASQKGNWFFLVYTLLVLASFFICITRSAREFTTPYAGNGTVISMQEGNPQANGLRKPLLLPRSNQNESLLPGNTESNWGFYSFFPFGSWLGFLISLIIWIILIPICFYDDVWESLVKTYQRSKGSVEAWQHTRKPFQYSVEVIRHAGKNLSPPQYSYNKTAVEKPETKEQALEVLKKMGLGDLKSFFIKYDFLTDLGVAILDRVVLSKIFKGTK